MTIIALKGGANCGKSETLGIHLREMIYRHQGINKTIIDKDSRESISFNNIIIDICPPGDTEDLVLSNIAFFENNPCDISYTATRTSGRGCRALEEYTLNKDVRVMCVWKDYNNLEKQGQTDGG